MKADLILRLKVGDARVYIPLGKLFKPKPAPRKRRR